MKVLGYFIYRYVMLPGLSNTVVIKNTCVTRLKMCFINFGKLWNQKWRILRIEDVITNSSNSVPGERVQNHWPTWWFHHLSVFHSWTRQKWGRLPQWRSYKNSHQWSFFSQNQRKPKMKNKVSTVYLQVNFQSHASCLDLTYDLWQQIITFENQNCSSCLNDQH